MLRLSALSPFGPIFGKELRTTARRKRTYLLRFLYLAILLLVLWGIYLEARPDRYSYGLDGGVAVRAQQAARLGQAFFGGFALFCVISMTLIPPILTATAISAERQAKTLPVLLMTPITSWQIVSGKLLSRLLAAFTLIGLSLPVLAVVRLLGGVDLDRMLWVIAICVVTSLFTAAIGLFFSTFMSRAYAVILLSYATVLFLYLFVPMIIGFMVKPRGPALGFAQFLSAINPFACVMFIVEWRAPLRGIGITPTIVTHLVGTAVLVLWSGAVLRKLARREGEGRLPAAESTLPPQIFAPPPLPDQAAPQGAPPQFIPYRAPEGRAGRTVADNPVLWRELRRPLTNRRWQAVTATIVSLVLLLITYLGIGSSGGRGLGDPDAQTGYAIIFCGVMSILVCVISATGIAGEKESDTWTILLGTPLGARQIVLGKLAGQFRRLLWPGVLVVSHFALFTITGVISPLSCIGILWVMLTFNVIWAATGLYLSLRIRTVTFAVILNLLMPIAVYFMVPLLLMIVGSLIDERRLPEAALWFDPYPFLMSVVEGFSRNRSFWLPFDHQVNGDTFLAVVFGLGLAYVGLAGVVVGYTIARFNRIVGRAAQREPLPRSGEGRQAAFLPHG